MSCEWGTYFTDIVKFVVEERTLQSVGASEAPAGSPIHGGIGSGVSHLARSSCAWKEKRTLNLVCRNKEVEDFYVNHTHSYSGNLGGRGLQWGAPAIQHALDWQQNSSHHHLHSYKG